MNRRRIIRSSPLRIEGIAYVDIGCLSLLRCDNIDVNDYGFTLRRHGEIIHAPKDTEFVCGSDSYGYWFENYDELPQKKYIPFDEQQDGGAWVKYSCGSFTLTVSNTAKDRVHIDELDRREHVIHGQNNTQRIWDHFEIYGLERRMPGSFGSGRN